MKVVSKLFKNNLLTITLKAFVNITQKTYYYSQLKEVTLLYNKFARSC